MIAKITRGSRVGDIAGYLHGPGKANEHRWMDAEGQAHSGGIVIGSNIGMEGMTDAAEWAPELRAAHKTRPDITKPIWHTSLRNTAGDRTLSDAEWADAAQTFAESMGYADHPWVAVRHGDDHIHIVVSRVNNDGGVWHGRNDRRQAQTACTALERDYGLEAAPRQRVQPKQPRREVQAGQRAKVVDLAARRAEYARKAARDRAELERIQRQRAVAFPEGAPVAGEGRRGSGGGRALTARERVLGVKGAGRPPAPRPRDPSYQERQRTKQPRRDRDTGRER